MSSNKENVIAWIIAALLSGGVSGYLLGSIANDNDDSTQTHTANHSEEAMEGSHEHGKFEVSEDMAPGLSFTVAEDTKSGWNILLDTENFNFTPTLVGKENTAGQGHAHLYVNGKKYARLYSKHFHYPENFDGERTFRVTLNVNDHSEYSVNGEVVEYTETINHAAH